jgi:hypothetical protein
MSFNTTPAIWVDFNDIYDQTMVETTLENTADVVVWPEEGDLVRLRDDDGATCIAIVRRRVNDILRCELALATWQDPVPEPTFAFAFVSNATPAATVGQVMPTGDGALAA